MRRTNLFLASLTLFLLSALGCQQKPESIVGSNEAEKSLSKANAERWFLTFKGRVEFSDGTVYESRTEKTVALPQRLWGREWTEETESLDQNYYIDFLPQGVTFVLPQGGLAIFWKDNLHVHLCQADWSTRSIVTVVYNPTNVGGSHYSSFYDSTIGTFIQSPVGFIPPGQAGTFYSPFSNQISATFDIDGDIDRNDVTVQNYDQSTSHALYFTVIRHHMRSQNVACQ